MKFDMSVIIPTFNEKENIGKIVPRINEVFAGSGINGEIIVVDDNSKDGTQQIVADLAKKTDNIKLLIRYQDPGLSQSVIDGFRAARSDIFLVIDADFSHPTELIPSFYREIMAGNDIVVGSRYIAGGNIVNWPLQRRIISKGATLLGRLIVPRVKDPVSGFFAIRREVIVDAPLKPKGYKILLEILGRGHWRLVKEIPFTFKDRVEGSSKLKGKTMKEYALQVLDILKYKATKR